MAPPQPRLSGEVAIRRDAFSAGLCHERKMIRIGPYVSAHRATMTQVGKQFPMPYSGSERHQARMPTDRVDLGTVSRCFLLSIAHLTNDRARPIREHHRPRVFDTVPDLHELSTSGMHIERAAARRERQQGILCGHRWQRARQVERHFAHAAIGAIVQRVRLPSPRGRRAILRRQLHSSPAWRHRPDEDVLLAVLLRYVGEPLAVGGDS